MVNDWNILKILKKDVKNAEKQLNNLTEGQKDYMKEVMERGKFLLNDYVETIENEIDNKAVDEYIAIFHNIADFVEDLIQSHLDYEE